jgi:triacylglycerol lipase
MRAFV